jgi:hypothetical protein
MAPKKKNGGSPNKKKSAAGSPTMTSEAAELLAEALAYKDIEFTRRIQVSELVIPIGAGHLGVTLANHPLGVLVLELNDVDKAYQAGLRPGDVLIEVNGDKVTSHTAAAELMFVDQSSVKVAYYAAKVADKELMRKRRPTEFVAIDITAGQFLGLVLANHPLGVVVLDIEPADLGYQAGLRPGDVLVTLNGQAIVHHQHAVAVMESIVEAGSGVVRLTYFTARAAAIELVLISSYGPSASHGLSDNGVITSSASTATHRGAPKPPGKPAVAAASADLLAWERDFTMTPESLDDIAYEDNVPSATAKVSTTGSSKPPSTGRRRKNKPDDEGKVKFLEKVEEEVKTPLPEGKDLPAQVGASPPAATPTSEAAAADSGVTPPPVPPPAAADPAPPAEPEAETPAPTVTSPFKDGKTRPKRKSKEEETPEQV